MVNTKLMQFSDSSGWGSPPKRKKIRILLADDHTAIREAMAGLFELKEDFEVVGQAGDGVEAVQLAEQTKPDVVLMDVSMPRMDGFEATALIKRKNPEICIIGLSIDRKSVV